MKRVVVTGMAALTPIGQDWESVLVNLQNGKTGVVRQAEWDRYSSLRTRLAAPVQGFEPPDWYSRKQKRSMGRVALMATRATEMALEDAGLLADPFISSGKMGVAYGSSSGTPDAIGDFGKMITEYSMEGLTANTYLRMMPHTTAVNIGVYFGLTGRIIPTSSACTSGSQGLGYAYEAIKYGRQLAMVAGGAEELDATQAAVFDTMFATSTKNDIPEESPRPFDRDRDGLVIGEGAGACVLEELEHAQARGARIHAEVVGFHCNSDGAHITQPNADTMQIAMIGALEDAQIDRSQIGYINAHGTATTRGDIAESHATSAVFGNSAPISSLKSFIGHTLGACGAIEAWASIEMMKAKWFAPTANLVQVDEQCADLDYIIKVGRDIDCEYVMSNNFAFGGINTSIIFKRWT